MGDEINQIKHAEDEDKSSGYPIIVEGKTSLI
jgi:hypothetical protein